MPSIIDSLLLFIPEIAMIVGAIMVLMLGVFGFSKTANIIAFVSTLITLGLIFNLSDFNIDAFNGMLYWDAYIKFGKCAIVLTTFVILIMVNSYKKQFEMPVLVMLSTAGMMFMISSNTLLTLYISLELVSLPLYILAAFNRDESKSAEAGMKYFILGSIASGLFLMGATFIYGFTGYIGFNEIYDYYVNFNSEVESVVIPIGFLIGLIFIVVAFAFKVSAAPFHMWAPDVYEGSPTLVTTFLASAPKVAMLMIFIRILMDPFGELYIQWQQVLFALAIASMFIGSLGAIKQSNFKRLLAYSSIGHVGFMLTGLISAENEGVKGILIYMVIYLSMSMLAFTSLLVLKKDEKPIEKISDLSGLSKVHPNMALTLAILMLSMAGIPPMAGFFAKFYILIPLIKAEMYILASMFVVASVVAAYYYLRIIKVMYFDQCEDDQLLKFESPLAVRIIIISCVLFNLLYIAMPSPLIKAAEIASMALAN